MIAPPGAVVDMQLIRRAGIEIRGVDDGLSELLRRLVCLDLEVHLHSVLPVSHHVEVEHPDDGQVMLRRPGGVGLASTETLLLAAEANRSRQLNGAQSAAGDSRE